MKSRGTWDNMNLVFLGMPGSGKGTQAQRYAREHGMHHYSSGDAYRDLLRDADPVATEMQNVIAVGGFYLTTFRFVCLRKAFRKMGMSLMEHHAQLPKRG